MRRGYGGTLELHEIRWQGPQLAIRWGVGGRRFTTSLWYESIDWDDLATAHGRQAARSLAFHIAMFEITKGASFGPDRVAVAPEWTDLLSEPLVAVWREVVHRVWAQWRYEHDRPHDLGPALRPQGVASQPIPRPQREATSSDTLWFCGGGKDSLLTSHVLAATGVSFDALVYTHSTYGPVERQLALADRLVRTTGAGRTHRLFVFDDALDVPLDRLGAEGPRYVLAAETPASLFAALPISLVHGYERLCVGHERSANAANLRWDATGEDVNHQWGKSLEAETLLGSYVDAHVLAGTEYVSPLAPVNDALIFGALREIGDRFALTHSCNVEKPWCLRCPKCAYVWISAVAWLPDDVVAAAFGRVNLLDDPANDVSFRQMLGLASHTPFECIGQVDEVRLAFSLASARGVTGAAMRHLDDVPAFDPVVLVDRLLTVDRQSHRMRGSFADAVLRHFDRVSADARSFAAGLLGSSARIVP